MHAELLPVPQRLAFNYAPHHALAASEALFAFDARLGELIGKANEPLLAQLRLAWWRDEFAKPVEGRARGDPVLDALSAAWTGEEAALSALVDGWENLVGEAPLPERAIAAFADARGGAAAALARLIGEPAAQEPASDAARVWALADLAAHLGDETERATALRLAAEHGAPPRHLPRALRPLAVLYGLARRALARGGGPLVRGRRDVLTAARLGMLGR